MSKTYVLTNYYTYGYNYMGGALYSSSLINGKKYYVTSCSEPGMAQEVLLGSFVYDTSMYSVSVGELWFDFGDGYCYFADDNAGSTYISVYYDDSGETGGSSGSSSSLGTITLSSSGIASWTIKSHLTIHDMYLVLHDGFDYVGDPVYLDTANYSGSYDFSSRIESNGTSGRTYRVELTITYYDYTTDYGSNTTLISESVEISSPGSGGGSSGT